jgi:hypothetical protein
MVRGRGGQLRDGRLFLLKEWNFLCVLVALMVSGCCVLHFFHASSTDSSGCVMTFMYPSYQTIEDSTLLGYRYTLKRYIEGSAPVQPGMVELKLPASHLLTPCLPPPPRPVGNQPSRKQIERNS